MKGQHFEEIYNALYHEADKRVSRGGKVLELRNQEIVVPPYDYLTTFEARKLNLDYCKAEWAWYLRGDRYDTSIEQYAKLWKKIRAPDGGFNSNYGQYIFGEKQFDWVVDSLVRDPDSRQASMQLLNTSHMYKDNPDVVCTHGINFQIRDDRLDMTVMMRSNDAIFGMTNDVFCFGQLLLAVHAALQAVDPEQFTGLEVGDYTHFTCSLHVYERHFDMLRNIAARGMSGHYIVEQPRPTSIDCFTQVAKGEAKSEYAKWILDYER